MMALKTIDLELDEKQEYEEKIFNFIKSKKQISITEITNELGKESELDFNEFQLALLNLLSSGQVRLTLDRNLTIG
jgi:hypothetical protein